MSHPVTLKADTAGGARAAGDRSVANTLALPCTARQVLYADCAEAVLEAARRAEAAQLPLLPLGQGSNVVLPPVLEAAVLHLTDDSLTLLKERAGQVTLRVGAAMDWHRLVLASLEMHCYGLENLALIPGCVGAAPVQNIGAYGRELAEFVVAVHGVDLERRSPVQLAAGECGFAYRDSVFKGELRERFVITALDLRLSPHPDVELSYPVLAQQFNGRSDVPTPAEVCAAVIALRRERLPDPAQTPNVGSFFKNPVLSAGRFAALRATNPTIPGFEQPDGSVKVPAAWLIDACELRGFRLGGAGVSGRHALVLVNLGGASQEDILGTAEHVRREVRARFAVTLEAEPRIY